MPSECRRFCEERGIVDMAGLMMAEAVIDDKARREIIRITPGVAGPDLHHAAEIDVEHDAAEIEQQRVGGAGGEGGEVMWR